MLIRDARSLRTTICFGLLPICGQASFCHTITNGDLEDQLIWDCGCDPNLCDTLLIDHHVTVTGSHTFTQLLVKIEAGGALSSSDTLTFQGLFFNEGTADVYRLVQPIGTPWWANHGILTSNVVWLWGDSAENKGTVHATDTLNLGPNTDMFNYGSLVGNFLWAGYLYNFDTTHFEHAQVDEWLINDGWIFDPAAYCKIDGLLTNLGFLQNYYGAYLDADTLWNLNHMDNRNYIRCDSLLQFGAEWWPGSTDLSDDFPTTARIECGNLKNYGHIQGMGDICVRDSSINYSTGVIDHTPDICDASLTTTVEPFIDVDLGTVGVAVNWCAATNCTTGLPDRTERKQPIRVYPLPAETEAHLVVPTIWRLSTVDLTDAVGQHWITPFRWQPGEVAIDGRTLPAGMYYVRLFGRDGEDLGNARILFMRP